MYNKSKFVFAEMFSNSNGKTSGSAVGGISLIAVSVLSFMACMIGYFMNIPNTIEVMSKIIELSLFGGTLLGVRKAVAAVNGNSKNKEIIEKDIK